VQVEFESENWKQFIIFHFQAIGSRRFQRGLHRVNLHRPTASSKGREDPVPAPTSKCSGAHPTQPLHTSDDSTGSRVPSPTSRTRSARPQRLRNMSSHPRGSPAPAPTSIHPDARGLHSLTSELNLRTFGTIAHIRAQLEHLRATSTVFLGSMRDKVSLSRAKRGKVS
jgi:hypothetical protein